MLKTVGRICDSIYLNVTYLRSGNTDVDCTWLLVNQCIRCVSNSEFSVGDLPISIIVW